MESNELKRGIQIKSDNGIVGKSVLISAINSILSKPQPIDALTEFEEQIMLFKEWDSKEPNREREIDAFLRNCHSSIKIMLMKTNNDISDELASQMLQKMANLIKLPIDEVEARLNKIDEEYWAINAPKSIPIVLQTPTIVDLGGTYTKPHKPNTGFKLGSYVYKSKRK
jgi:hypothetical protein